MKLSILTALLLSTTAGLAIADNLPVASHVDSVTVYPQGADVSRLAKVDVPKGETVLLFDDLPDSVDPQSVRVEGVGAVEITSVDTKKITSPENGNDEAHRKIAEALEKLADERATLDQVIADQEAQRKLLLSLADKSLAPSSTTEKSKVIDTSAIESLIGVVGNRLGESSKAIHDAKLRQKQIDKDVTEINVKLEALAPATPQHVRTAVHVAANAATSAQLKLSYRVQDASWHAFYDAKLALPKSGAEAPLALVRRAEVRQDTGESWDNVSLILSTAQPSRNAQAPKLDEQDVGFVAPPPMAAAAGPLRAQPALREKLAKAKSDVMQEAELDVPAPIAQKQAVAQSAGFNAQYIIADRATVDNSGTAKAVGIGTDQLTAKLTVESVPRLDANAYLSAAFTAKSEAPLLAGPVNLFRDDVYVGQINIDEIAAGDEAKLGFGVDDLVKVKRVEVNRLKSQTGIFTASNTKDMAWTISVTNLHGVKMPIRIIDRKPFSSDAKIVVSDIANATPPSVVDVDHKRGLLAWDLALDAKGKAEIKTGYRIVAPENTNLSLNE